MRTITINVGFKVLTAQFAIMFLGVNRELLMRFDQGALSLESIPGRVQVDFDKAPLTEGKKGALGKRGKSSLRKHYQKGTFISVFFEDREKVFLLLPTKDTSVLKHERLKPIN